MYARVVTATFKPATMERGLHTLQDEVRPNVTKQPGFQGWEVLIDRQTGFTQTTTRWATEAEAKAAAKEGFRERTAMLEGLLEGTTSQAVYEVVG